ATAGMVDAFNFFTVPRKMKLACEATFLMLDFCGITSLRSCVLCPGDDHSARKVFVRRPTNRLILRLEIKTAIAKTAAKYTASRTPLPPSGEMPNNLSMKSISSPEKWWIVRKSVTYSAPQKNK